VKVAQREMHPDRIALPGAHHRLARGMATQPVVQQQRRRRVIGRRALRRALQPRQPEPALENIVLARRHAMDPLQHPQLEPALFRPDLRQFARQRPVRQHEFVGVAMHHPIQPELVQRTAGVVFLPCLNPLGPLVAPGPRPAVFAVAVHEGAGHPGQPDPRPRGSPDPETHAPRPRPPPR